MLISRDSITSFPGWYKDKWGHRGEPAGFNMNDRLHKGDFCNASNQTIKNAQIFIRVEEGKETS